jgi:LuxR family quorum sensing-dependent transcriptional regulator
MLMPNSALDGVREVFAVIDELDRLSSANEATDTVAQALAPFGTEAFLFATIVKPQQRLDEAVLLHRWPAEFLKLYSDARYIEVDPVARALRSATRPFECHEVSFDPKREPRAAEAVCRRSDFGFTRGLLVPILGDNGISAFASISGPKLDLSGFNKVALHLIALYAFDSVRRLRAPHLSGNGKHSLTPREREVLTWVANGKSAWEIGEILNIAKRTVDEHVRTACRKLDAVNRTQAVAIAMRDRAIDP